MHNADGCTQSKSYTPAGLDDPAKKACEGVVPAACFTLTGEHINMGFVDLLIGPIPHIDGFPHSSKKCSHVQRLDQLPIVLGRQEVVQDSNGWHPAIVDGYNSARWDARGCVIPIEDRKGETMRAIDQHEIQPARYALPGGQYGI